MQQIVFTDSHIQEDCLEELDKVFSEILTYSKGKPVLVCVGDYYEKKNPTPREIDFGTKWVIKFKQAFKNFIMVTGNHPDIDGKISTVSYMSYLGIEVVPDLTLDGVHYAHYMVKESLCGFNESREGSQLATNYALSILGHQHTPQIITIGSSRIIHLGSCRYVDFGEAQDKSKFIAVINNGQFQEIALKSVRPMIDVSTVIGLDSLSPTTQVRVVYRNFNQFLAEADKLPIYEKKFWKFRVKHDYSNVVQPVAVNLVNTDKEIVRKWINKINDQDIRRELESEFKDVLK